MQQLFFDQKDCGTHRQIDVVVLIVDQRAIRAAISSSTQELIYLGIHKNQLLIFRHYNSNLSIVNIQ